MRALVTEVTDLRSQVCVAAFDLENEGMIRPLSAVGHHWTFNDADTGIFQVGNILDFIPTRESNNRGYPHSNEDLIVQRPLRIEEQLSLSEVFETLKPHAHQSVTKAFNDSIIQNSLSDNFVLPDTNCPSLSSCTLPNESVLFSINRYERFRCEFADSSGITYDLSVTCRALHKRLENEGLEAINAALHTVGKESLILRLGLANPWAERENRSYLQLNGVIVP